MKKSRCRTARKGGGSALLPEKKAHRKPKFRLTTEQILEQCRRSGHEMICAGHVLVTRELMLAHGWPNAVVAAKAHISESHFSEFLRLEKFFTTDTTRRLARAFNLKLSKMDSLAEDKVEDKDSL